MRDVAAAWRIVQEAAEGGLIVGGCRWGGGGQRVADIDVLPAGRIAWVQLCDVRADPMEPLRAESLGHRLPPGKGHGDTLGLVRGLAKRGVTPTVMAVEVISDELVARGVDIAAQVSADAAREVLASAATHRI